MSRLESVNAQLDAYKDLPAVSVHFTIATFALTCPGGLGLVDQLVHYNALMCPFAL